MTSESEKWVVQKIEEGMDRTWIEATTYQMRNPFNQFADGVVTEEDVHCYFQHMYAASLCPLGGRVLDVCCGRGLLIPFLRYGTNQPSLYVGIDIKSSNARWAKGSDPRRESTTKTDWGFKRAFIETNAAVMAAPIKAVLGDIKFDLIVYTSSIEHMQPESQQASLEQCAELGDLMYLTCPISDPGESGYDARYAAHVYEPTEAELFEWLRNAGWKVKQRTGLSTKSAKFKTVLKGGSLEVAMSIYNSMPRPQALPAIANLYPQTATEVAYTCTKQTEGKENG